MRIAEKNRIIDNVDYACKVSTGIMLEYGRSNMVAELSEEERDKAFEQLIEKGFCKFDKKLRVYDVRIDREV